MHIVQEIQKLVYSFLKNMDNVLNVYSCPNKNVNFPYVIIETDKIEVENNFNNNLYEITVNIKIFDKNETNTQITNTASDIKNEILKLFNIELKNYTIIDVVSTIDNIRMYNELSSVWSEVLGFKFIINERKN